MNGSFLKIFEQIEKKKKLKNSKNRKRFMSAFWDDKTISDGESEGESDEEEKDKEKEGHHGFSHIAVEDEQALLQDDAEMLYSSGNDPFDPSNHKFRCCCLSRHRTRGWRYRCSTRDWAFWFSILAVAIASVILGLLL